MIGPELSVDYVVLTDHPGCVEVLELVYIQYIQFPVHRESGSQDDGKKKNAKQPKIECWSEWVGRRVIAHLILSCDSNLL